MDEGKDSVDLLLEEYRGGRVDRREFVKRGAALGLGASALGGLLAGAAGAATRTREAAPKRGGTLREGYDLDFSRMDPVNTSWYDPGFYALYQSIVNKDPKGRIVPDIARSWKVSADGKTVTFNLRKGLKFHSGRPLTAQAIKEVYDAIADPKTGSPLRTLWVPHVVKTLAPNPTTLVLKLQHPYYDIFNVVQTGYWAIENMKTRNALGQDYGKKTIDGSGPFTFVDWVPGDHVSVKRWDEFPGSIVPYFKNKGKAYIDGIRWTAILEASQRATQIENGEIDTLRGPNPPDIPRLLKNKNLKVTQLKEWSGYVLGTNFKRTELGFDDPKVRSAISHALDRKAIADKLFEGFAFPMYGPITSADAYYTKKVEKYSTFDPDLSKKLLDEAGWKEGSGGVREKDGKKLSFALTIQAETLNQQLGSVVQAELKNVGMDVKVKAFDRGTYFNNLFGGKIDMFLFYYLWPVPTDLITLFVNSAAANGKGPNWSNAILPSIDSAITRYVSSRNAKELRATSQALQVEIMKQLPIIPVVNRGSYWVNRKNVHGYLVHQWNLYPYYNDVWLS